MRKSLMLLPLFVLLAGCGGGGGPTPSRDEPSLPEKAARVYKYPAYRAVSPEGNELFLQVPTTAKPFDGRYGFFIKEGDQTHIMSGPVSGRVAADGAIAMTLSNPYDESVPPIHLRGRREGGKLLLADVEEPGKIETFEPLEEGRVKAVPVSRAVSAPAYIQIDVPNSTAKQSVKCQAFDFPVWLLPPAFLGWASTETTTPVMREGSGYTLLMSSWGNGWTQISISTPPDASQFSGWIPRNLDAVGRERLEIQDATVYLPRPTKTTARTRFEP